MENSIETIMKSNPILQDLHNNRKGENNVVIVKENGEKIINPPSVEGLNIILSGKNNNIIIYEPFSFNQSRIGLTGNCDVIINSGCQPGMNFTIHKIRSVLKNSLIIGKDFKTGRNCTIDLTDAGDISIGDDNKWSWNIYVKSDDTHPVYDITTKECLNKSTQIVIGNHVWIGMNAAILKNSEIKDNSIIGAFAVIANKKFNVSNIVIAGNPARIVKENVNWSHGCINDYIFKQKGK